MQLQKDLHNLKSGLELKKIKANSNISCVQSELIKSRQLVKQFQKAVEGVKDRSKEELLKRCDQLKMTIVKDTETKVMQLLLDKLSYRIKEFEKKFKKMLPNYEVSCYSMLIIIVSKLTFIK